MPRPYDEAKAAAIASGIQTPTPQDIVAFGWSPDDTFQNSYAQQSAPAVLSDDQVHTLLMQMHEEAVKNGVIASIGPIITSLIGVLGKGV